MMLIRIVKMTFKPEEVSNFRSFFDEKKALIRRFEGCEHLELYQDKAKPELFFTYSFWQNETALENYRQSEIFTNIWTETKKMFAGKPEAWSVNKIASLP